MDVGMLARGQAVNRIAIGAGLVLFPRVFARIWVGGRAREEHAQVLARAMGARDLALGAGGVLALGERDPDWASRVFAAQAVADAIDLVAILRAGRSVPLHTRLGATVLAGGSAAVAAAYARQLAG